MTDVNISTMTIEHWPQVLKIYAEGIKTGAATFEIDLPNYKDWNQNHLEHCRLVIESHGTIFGWAALSPVSSRSVYRGVAEVSVYMSEKSRGMGYGTLLMNQLIYCSEKNGLWTLRSGIFPTNIASIKLHEKVGFRLLGIREKIGQLNGIWHDNLIYERRSKIVGK